jgi:hypothetical protein
LEAPDEKKGKVRALDHGLGHRGEADSSEEAGACQGPFRANPECCLCSIPRALSHVELDPSRQARLEVDDLGLTYYRSTRGLSVRIAPVQGRLREVKYLERTAG